MERRELFKIMVAGAAVANDIRGQHQHPEVISPPDVLAYEPRFFQRREYAAMQRLCDILIPPDRESPGASEAGVGFYIDTTLLYGTPAAQEAWRSGLRLVDDITRKTFRKSFVECSPGEQEQIVALMARNEAMPETALEKFFGTLKNATVQAYVLSERGMREYLGYKGDTILPEFPGCRDQEI